MAFSPLVSWLDLRRTHRLSGDDLEQLQRSRLRRIIEHSYRNVPLYRDVFDRLGLRPESIRSRDDLQRLPVIDKQKLQSTKIEDRLSRNANPNKCHLRHTGGSTGRPLAFCSQATELDFEAMGWIRTWKHLGLELRDHQATIKYPDDVHIRRSGKWYQKLGLLRVSYVDLRHPAPALLDEVASLRPDVLRAPPSVILSLARESDRRGSRTPFHPRLIFSTSEKLLREGARHLEDCFGAEIHDCYGATEAGCIGWRCPHCQLYHLNSDFLIVEVLKDGKPAAPGQIGEVVITSLVRWTMPIIRLSLGDLCEAVDSGNCPMSLGPLSLRRILGRTVESFLLPDGSEVSPYCLMPDDIPGILAYKIVQEATGDIRILVVPGNDFDIDLVSRERANYEAELGGQLSVSFHRVETLPADCNTGSRYAIAGKVDAPRVART